MKYPYTIGTTKKNYIQYLEETLLFNNILKITNLIRMRTFLLISSSVLFLLFSSCDNFFVSEIDPPKKATEPELVVHSYISPDEDEILVSVTLSNPIFSDQSGSDTYTIVESAVVTITSEADNTVIIPYNLEKEKYVIDADKFKIAEGETYNLKIKTEDGEEVASTCTVPSAIKSEIQNIQIQKREDYKYQLSFEFIDNPDENNYYRAVAYVTYIYSDDKEEEEKLSVLFDLFTDYNRNGQTIYVKEDDIFLPSKEIKEITINLYSIDRNYYLYHRSAITQLDNEGNEIFSEPGVIISNIKNGIGVFGSYTKISTVKKL